MYVGSVFARSDFHGQCLILYHATSSVSDKSGNIQQSKNCTFVYKRL